ncbi:8-amino-7-oxononanoate synthase [Photobacterium atrarenae]|uniref:8-amino-7-oxononanoate synthase n=1 Tax=Photobacterium atrarenae TaxID=865757 RepID=A0ABY5GIW9_9GAMM|nr:8-amino-7-oxononanoate synthase [Photobacterium atrarenae]UTV29243.1 8-amino-7-oxononanoate synthase [Photobacterium atrarenae]
MPRFKQRIDQALGERQDQGLYRQRTCLTRTALQTMGPDGAMINFSSNDYLGLAQDPELISAWQEGLSQYGAGSGASPLVTGFQTPHQELEALLADWLGFDRALLFSSGFSANQALLFSLLQADDFLLQDKLNHASLMEAGSLSPATMRRFPHNDMQVLQRLLKRSDAAAGDRLVVTEGVFSMDGDLAPLAEIHTLTRAHQSWLAVDDAHGCGVLGEEGRGSCDFAGIRPDILVVTFGKAFGLQGAAILCDHGTAEYLVQFARHFIYSTAMPPAQAHALSTACRLIRRDQWRRDKLAELSALLSELVDPAIALQSTPTPIKPLIIGGSEQAVAVSTALRERGIWVSAIRPPTVPANSARLRITLTAAHSQADVKKLAHSMNEVIHGE